MPPPKLAAYAPVLGVSHPVAVGVLELRRIETDVVIHNGLEGRFGKFVHLQEPLHGELRLDYYLRALRIPHLVVVILDFFNQALFLKVGNDFLADIETVMPHIHPAGFRNCAVGIEYVDCLEIVFFPEHIVVHVMGRRYLEAACAEIHLHILIHYHWHGTPYQRHDNLLPFEPLITFVVGIDTYGGIAEDGFRTRSRHNDVAVFPLYIIFKVEQLRMLVLVDDLFVRKCREGSRIPVDHAHTAIYVTFFVKVAKHTDNTA